MAKSLILTGVCLFFIFSGVFASVIPEDGFDGIEWKMKLDNWRAMQELNQTDDIQDQSDFDVKYWELDIDVTNISGQIVTGKVTMTSEAVISGLTEVAYDFHDAMSVDSVFMYNQPVSYTHANHYVTVTLDRTYNYGEQFTTVIYYHGHPPRVGDWGSFFWDTHQGEPIVSTLSEPEGARAWWPCKDMPHDKADSADVLITVDEDLVATSNGVLVSNQNNGNGTRTFHWHEGYPITTYLISLAISNYAEFTDWYVTASNDSMPIVNYVYPEHLNQAMEDLNVTAEAIGIYAQFWGEYPFLDEKYGHSIFQWGGAMEHQCNTSYGAPLITGHHYYDYIVVHELAHMWFGDRITCDTWPDIWINEGFAVFSECVWTEYLGGFDEYIDYLLTRCRVTDPSGPIYDPDPLFSGNTVYNKGAWALHMLRGVMGDDAFFEGMHDYANDPQFTYKTATCRQFQHYMEQYYGDSLGWYFDEWLWGMNRPTYRYSWMAEDIGGGQYEIFLNIRQTQGDPAPLVFTMPIKMYPRIGGVDTMISVFNDKREDNYRFIVNGSPTTVELDKDYWILRYCSPESYGLNIVTTELPVGYLNVAYDSTIEARGGSAPYVFSLISGTLPPGIELFSDGRISGRPSAAGDYEFTVRVTDNASAIDDQDFTVSVLDSIPVFVSIDMIPDDPPVNVPAGGSFTFTGVLENNTGDALVGDVWIKVRLPDGRLYGPVERFNNIPLNPHQYISVPGIEQQVPGFTPAGVYDYVAYSGRYPSIIIDSAFFEFTVTTPSVGDASDWILSGWFDEDIIADGIPSDFALSANYPNPFNARTTVEYQLPTNCHVRLDVYNISGQKVETLVDGEMPMGHHEVNWDASAASSGVYFYSLKAGDFHQIRKMTLIK
jgi:aminopeptidase N